MNAHFRFSPADGTRQEPPRLFRSRWGAGTWLWRIAPLLLLMLQAAYTGFALAAAIEAATSRDKA